MYNIIRESILSPKDLIKYHKKKGWFVFLYIIFLSVLLSISMFVFLIAFKNPTITNDSTGCTVVDGSFVCEDNDNLNQKLSVYGVPMFFLSDGQEVSDVALDGLDTAIIVKGENVYYRFGTTTMTSFNISKHDSVSSFYKSVRTNIVVTLVIFTIVQNSIIMLFIILVSTLPFLRFRKEIRYKKIFKLVTFAATPIALLLLINNLLNLGTFIFFILMFLGYRSIFSLQKELFLRSAVRKEQAGRKQPGERENESIHPDDIIDQEEDEE